MNSIPWLKIPTEIVVINLFKSSKKGPEANKKTQREPKNQSIPNAQKHFHSIQKHFTKYPPQQQTLRCSSRTRAFQLASPRVQLAPLKAPLAIRARDAVVGWGGPHGPSPVVRWVVVIVTRSTFHLLVYQRPPSG